MARHRKFNVDRLLDRLQGYEGILRAFVGRWDGRLGLDAGKIDVPVFRDFLLNGESHLRYTDKQGKEHKCFFVDVRELFIGDTKAFVVASIQDEK